MIPLYSPVVRLVSNGSSDGEPITGAREARLAGAENELVEVELVPEVLSLGSGIPKFNRDVDLQHKVIEGETLSEIAYIYKVDLQKLSVYNGITNPDSIPVGYVIRIPSFDNEKKIELETVAETVQQAFMRPEQTASSKLPVHSTLTIVAEKHYDGTAVTAHFTVRNRPEEKLTSFEWDLGNHRKSFRESTYWTYDTPGTYKITLKARNSKGQLLTSNPIFIDVPHPATYRIDHQQFITLGSENEAFYIDGTLSGVLNYETIEDSPIQEITSGASIAYRAKRPGYYNLKVQKDGLERDAYLFVSPIESRHSDRNDVNWYRTQFNTGTPSNCGPAVVSMGISWATGKYIPVSEVRQQIGWKDNGGTSFLELVDNMRRNEIDARLTPVGSAQDIFDIIDAGNIAVVLYHSGAVKRATGNLLENLFGRYYQDSVGHYVIVKGYSTDRRYFIVYDPIPSDWGSNSLRYADGNSMIGRNRYYPVSEIFGSLRRSDVIEIRR
jgi:PKD repeat protein